MFLNKTENWVYLLFWRKVIFLVHGHCSARAEIIRQNIIHISLILIYWLYKKQLCSSRVYILFIQRIPLFIYGGNLVRNFASFSLFIFKFRTVATVPDCTVATVVTFFFFLGLVFVFFFFYIYIYIYCYTDTKNFTIFSQLLRYQFLISQNKIIKYETITNHNWK